jgi:lysozyme
MNYNAVVDRLKGDEGWSATPYKDSLGVWTIGYGTNITKISEEEGLLLLHSRLLGAEADLEANLPWVKDLDDARAGVLLNMCYNMGIGTLLTFTKTLAAVQRGDWAAAKVGMLGSLWAQQVGPRATRLAEIMLTGKEI